MAPPETLVPPPDRLGVAVKMLGQPGLKSDDARRWQNEPHLRVSLQYLDAIFDYLGDVGIRMYRMSSNIAPYATHPDMPQFHGQIAECREEMAQLGEKARRLDLRLSLHPPQFIVLNSPHEHVVQSALGELAHQAALLDAFGCGPEAKVIIHGGGVYGDRAAAMARFVERYATLPEAVTQRLVLENDETSYSVPDIVAIHEQCGVPLVFDILHHRVNNPAGLSETEACRMCLSSWPAEQIPKIHYSSQRVTPGSVPGADDAPAPKQRIQPGHHADFIDGADFVAFMSTMSDARFDVMLEAKQKDLALLQLRGDIAAAELQARIW